jgi:hypothetical protein
MVNRERLCPSRRWPTMQYEVLARRIVVEVARCSIDGGYCQAIMLHEVARRLRIDEASAETAMRLAVALADRWGLFPISYSPNRNGARSVALGPLGQLSIRHWSGARAMAIAGNLRRSLAFRPGALLPLGRSPTWWHSTTPVLAPAWAGSFLGEAHVQGADRGQLMSGPERGQEQWLRSMMLYWRD